MKDPLNALSVCQFYLKNIWKKILNIICKKKKLFENYLKKILNMICKKEISK